VVVNKVDVMSKEELNQNNAMDWLKTALKTEMVVLGFGKEEAGDRQLPNGNFEVKFDSAFEALGKNREEE